LDNQVTIQAYKYGNQLHYEWCTTLLEKAKTHIFVLGHYGRKLHHYTKQKVFTVNNWTIEFFPFDSWFTVSADVVDGKIQQYYCNINEPAKIDGHTVSFVDLDLDLIQRNGEWKVVDEDEFEMNAIKFAYSDELIHRAREELINLQSRIHNKQFPFDGSIERFIDYIPK
jgi:protein associated with RNAse G/E